MPSTSSCTPQEPFIKLDPLGTASVLSYNLPEKTAYEVKGYIDIKVNSGCWNSIYLSPPTDNWWDKVEGLPASQILEMLNDDILGSSANPSILNSRALTTMPLVDRINNKIKEENAAAVAGRGGPAVGGGRGNAVSQPQQIVKENEESLICGLSTSAIIAQINKGRRPMISRNLYGKPVITFLPKPVAPTPKITLVLHYKMATFPGNYGAGRTIKTFTLLPGEKTTISISNFRHDETVSSQSKSILDSFSESSAQEFQNTVENQLASDTATQNSTNKEKQLGGGVNLASLGVPVEISGGVSNSTTTSTAITNHISQLTSATDTHTTQASQNRNIEVNTDVKVTTITESTETTIRELRNINLSRTLNFIFRQLMQEFVTLTYLDDVSIVFSNGYPEHKKVVKLTNINDLLSDVLVDGLGGSPCENVIEKTRKGIFRQLCNIFDVEGDKISFMECITETITDCCGGGEEPYDNTYARKVKGLSQAAEGFTVPGIILDVTKRIMRTDSVVVDALLGQGEALDCFNQKLQDIGVNKAQLENDATEQQMAIIDGIDDFGVKADKYKKVFGPCCEVPQSCGCCGDCNCGETAPATI
jgi:hypothetical protein